MPKKLWWGDASGHVAKSLRVLYNEVNTIAPHRDTSDDGTIGDASHATRKSDHNKDAHGVVRALDITHDPANGCDCNAILQHILQTKDLRVSYLIFRQKIYNPKIQDWKGRAYHGSDPHTHHLHISVVDTDVAEGTQPWGIATALPAQPHPCEKCTSGKASVFGWFDGHHHWEDKEDEAGSAALMVPDREQGHAFPTRTTLGQWFWVRKKGAKLWLLSQQTDIGPGRRTGRKIDIHARLADALGYTPDNFPTDSVWEWQPAPPPAGTEHLTPQQQAAAYKTIQFISLDQPAPPLPPPKSEPPPPPQPPICRFDPETFLASLIAALEQRRLAREQGKPPMSNPDMSAPPAAPPPQTAPAPTLTPQQKEDAVNALAMLIAKGLTSLFSATGAAHAANWGAFAMQVLAWLGQINPAIGTTAPTNSETAAFGLVSLFVSGLVGLLGRAFPKPKEPQS